MTLPRLSSLYFFVWGTAIVLYSLNMISILSSITFEFIMLTFIVPIIIIVIIEFIISNLISRNSVVLDYYDFAQKLITKKKSIFRIYYFWFFLSLIDVLVSGFLPIFSGGGDSDLNYTDYGVHGLGGINNALAIILSFCFCYLIIYNINRKKTSFFLLSICVWQVLTLRRGILFSIVFVYLILFLIANAKKIKNIILKGFVVAFSLISVFGLLGDARGVKSPFNPLVRESFVNFFDVLPSGFLWVYVYITSSLDNFNNNIKMLSGTCEDVLFPLVSISPSFIRPLQSCEFQIQIDYLNVGTYLALYVSTGNIIAYFFYLTFPIIFTVYAREKFIASKNIGYLGVYVVLLLCWLLSPFTNLFFLPTYILAPIILILIFIKIKL